jgi:hypothetical protein
MPGKAEPTCGAYPEEGPMHDFIARLTRVTRKELLHIEGFLCMHRERYAEYARDLEVARARGDAKRAGEIAEDLRAFRGEIAHLERKQVSAYERLRTLARDERFPTGPSTDGGDAIQPMPDAANIIRLERAE